MFPFISLSLNNAKASRASKSSLLTVSLPHHTLCNFVGEISRKQWLTGKEGGGGGGGGGPPGMPPFGRPDENMSDERIAQILNEANQAMKGGQLPNAPPGVPANLAAAVAAAAAAAQQQEDARSNDSRSPASAQVKVNWKTKNKNLITKSEYFSRAGESR